MATIPYMKFYIGDWEQDLNACSLQTEAAWLKVIVKMFKDGECGIYKTTTKRLQRIWKCSTNDVQEIIEELKDEKVCGIEINGDDVVFQNRRMLKAKGISKIRSDAVQTRYKTSTKGTTKEVQNPEYDNDSEYDNEYNKEGVPNLKEVINYVNGMAGLKLSDEGCQAYIDTRKAVGWKKNRQDIVNWKADLNGFARIYKKNESANKTKPETDTVYHPKFKEYTPDEIKEIKAVQEGYERMKKEKPATRGKKLRKAVRGHDSIGETLKVKIQEIKP